MRGTVKSKAEMERVFGSGKRLNTKAIVLIFCTTPEGRDRHGRVAFVAGKKLGNAPARNRAKRIMREVCRELGGPVPGYDLVFLAKRAIFETEQGRIVSDCRRALAGENLRSDG